MNYVICRNKNCNTATKMDELLEGKGIDSFLAELETSEGYPCTYCGETLIEKDGTAMLTSQPKLPNLFDVQLYFKAEKELTDAYLKYSTTAMVDIYS